MQVRKKPPVSVSLKNLGLQTGVSGDRGRKRGCRLDGPPRTFQGGGFQRETFSWGSSQG